MIFAESLLQAGYVTQCVTHGEKVEGIIRQGHLFGSTEYKVRRQFGPGNRQHAITGIETGDIISGADYFGRLDRDQSGSAGYIEQMIPRAQPVLLESPATVGGSGVEEAPVHHGVVVLGPLVEQPVDELRLRLRCGVMNGKRGMGTHVLVMNKVPQYPSKTSPKAASRLNHRDAKAQSTEGGPSRPCDGTSRS